MFSKEPKIRREVESNIVGEAYNDQWNGEYIRVNLNDRPETEMHIDDLLQLIQRKGWEKEAYGNSGDSGLRIIETHVRRICSSCNSDPLYDTQENEWYCPKCE